MEFLPTTLYKRNQFYTMKLSDMPIPEIRSYIKQILQGLDYLHKQEICHRDIKPQNILVDHTNSIAKICDFGSAKILSPLEQNVSYICSRYYRAPELIFGATNYTTKIDIWSLGCVFAELLIGQPLFPGESGIDQLVEIIKILGTPTTQDILSMNSNYVDHKFPVIKKIPLIKIFKKLDNPEGLKILNFLEGFLLFNPTVRLSAEQALENEWINE
jgi:serine/threonine protein kinase